MSEPKIVKQTLTYDDGTEKVIEMVQNPNAEAIEATVAQATEEHAGEEGVSDKELQSGPVEVPEEEIDENQYDVEA